MKNKITKGIKIGIGALVVILIATLLIVSGFSEIGGPIFVAAWGVGVVGLIEHMRSTRNK